MNDKISRFDISLPQMAVLWVFVVWTTQFSWEDIKPNIPEDRISQYNQAMQHVITRTSKILCEKWLKLAPNESEPFSEQHISWGWDLEVATTSRFSFPDIGSLKDMEADFDIEAWLLVMQLNEDIDNVRAAINQNMLACTFPEAYVTENVD